MKPLLKEQKDKHWEFALKSTDGKPIEDRLRIADFRVRKAAPGRAHHREMWE